VSLAGRDAWPLPGDGASADASLTADGRYVAFLSGAGNLATNDLNQADDVFVRDLSAGTTALVTWNRAGDASANRGAANPRISPDGRYVAFESTASDLVEQELIGFGDVFVRDLWEGTTWLVSRSTYFGFGGNFNSALNPSQPCFSTNGQRLVFTSSAWDLTDVTDNNFNRDVFVRDMTTGALTLVSVNEGNSASASGRSLAPAISADGRYVAFQSSAPDVASPDNGGGYDVFVRDLIAGETKMVSVNVAGTGGGNYDSVSPCISADGRYVAFQSASTDFSALGDENFEVDVFWRDMQAGVTRLVSVNQAGTAAGNGYSWVFDLSADGRYVLFGSTAGDLVAGDANGVMDIFVRDMVTGTTELISTNRFGTGSGNGVSSSAKFSADGRRVVFMSQASNLTEDTKLAGFPDVFVRDRQTGITRLCSVDAGGGRGAAAPADRPQISRDGRVAVFDCQGGNLWAGDDNGVNDVFARELDSNGMFLVSANVSATPRAGSFGPQLSADGRYAGFTSLADNVVAADDNGRADAFLSDLGSGMITLVSANTNGFAGNGDSVLTALSADGRYAGFESLASDLVPGDLNDSGDAFLWDRVTGMTVLLSANATRTGSANAASGAPLLSPDGRLAVFTSLASDLTSLADTNGAQDVFLRELAHGTNDLISVNASGTRSGNRSSGSPSFTPDGRYVTFASDASDLVAGDANGVTDIFLRDRVTRRTLCVSTNRTGGGSGNGASSRPLVSANGRYVVFTSQASDLVAGDANGVADVFVRDGWSNVTRIVSVNRFGTGGGNGASWATDLSPDGRYVVLTSRASDLVANDGNGSTSDVFVRDLVAGTTTLVSVNCAGAGGSNGDSDRATISPDGRYVAFQSEASDLVPGQFVVPGPNVFRRDLIGGTTELLSRNRAGFGAGNGASGTPVMSANGAIVVFEGVAADLVAGDLNSAADVFAWVAQGAIAATDLELTMTASSGLVSPGDAVVFTLTVTNLGPLPATAVTVTDPLPPGFSFVSAHSTAGGCSYSGGTVTANLGELAVGAGARIAITTEAASAGDWSNAAVVGAVEFDSVSINNRATVFVRVQSTAPVLPPQDNRTHNELALLIVTNTATVAGFPGNLLTYTLENPPAGAAVNPEGVITWTPDEAQGPGVYTLKTIVADANVPPLKATNAFTVTVNEVNVAPLLPPQVSRTNNELALLTVINKATDSDLPANLLTYTLENPPAGVAIDPNGVITWTPDESQGPGLYTLRTIVTDNGVPPLKATNTLAVTVNEVNASPLLAGIADRTNNPGQIVSFAVSATDSDLPTNTLSFSLVTSLTGATLTGDGTFQWRPPVARAGMSNYITVRVTDDGSPPSSDTQSFVVFVNPLFPVTITNFGWNGQQAVFQVVGQAGPDYIVQAASALGGDWTDVWTNTPQVLPFNFADTNNAALSNRFYRVLLAP
ncbi:MAG TPA: hypothetical protein VI136_11610, partial [Verrucomicrobiae bacterium]